MSTISLKKQKKVNILKVQTDSFTSGASRTLITSTMEFLAVDWKLMAKYSFLEHIIRKTGILIIFLSSLWTRYSIKNISMQTFTLK